MSTSRSAQLATKSVFDHVVGAVLAVLFAPLMAIIAIFIKREDGGPAMFLQERPGKDEKPFTVYKFRSMIVDADRYLDDQGIPTRERTTKVGRFLRTSSLDELPQLINVAKGDMSLVGPRPTLMEYLPQFSDEHRQRFQMKPGITGLAQVRGRSGIPVSQRLALDVEYVRNFSLLLDLRILLETVVVVVRRTGSAVDRQPGLNDVLTPNGARPSDAPSA